MGPTGLALLGRREVPYREAEHLTRTLQPLRHHPNGLDQVIGTMRDTGADMQAKYKETAQGGLATHAGERVAIGVNVTEC